MVKVADYCDLEGDLWLMTYEFMTGYSFPLQNLKLFYMFAKTIALLGLCIIEDKNFLTKVEPHFPLSQTYL